MAAVVETKLQAMAEATEQTPAELLSATSDCAARAAPSCPFKPSSANTRCGCRGDESSPPQTRTSIAPCDVTTRRSPVVRQARASAHRWDFDSSLGRRRAHRSPAASRWHHLVPGVCCRRRANSISMVFDSRTSTFMTSMSVSAIRATPHATGRNRPDPIWLERGALMNYGMALHLVLVIRESQQQTIKNSYLSIKLLGPARSTAPLQYASGTASGQSQHNTRCLKFCLRPLNEGRF